jgi:hypothetical protein
MSRKLKLNVFRSDHASTATEGLPFYRRLPVLPTTLLFAAFAPNFESRFNYAPRTYSPRTYSLIHWAQGGEPKITLTKNKKHGFAINQSPANSFP